jgi:RimJ/RimL family protein N-acetyltransferase
MIRPLTSADTVEVLRLLAVRPLHTVFLESLVRAGALGSMPGCFFGCFEGTRLEGILLVALRGDTLLEASGPSACARLAEHAATLPIPPRHILGPEDTTVPFWNVYRPHASRVIWERREPVYLLSRGDLDSTAASAGRGKLVRGAERDVDAVVENSARQYVEDLQQDRRAEDPRGFRERHLRELRAGRWWVLRDRGQIAFQVHVGAENAHAVQLGGVFTPCELRGRGYATRGVVEISQRLLRDRPAVSLFCDAANATARHIYERVGFRVLFYNRSWLLEEASRGEHL